MHWTQTRIKTHVFAERSRLERGAKELYGGRPAVSLVATHLVPGSAQGGQGTPAQHHISQDTFCVSALDALVKKDTCSEACG